MFILGVKIGDLELAFPKTKVPEFGPILQSFTIRLQILKFGKFVLFLYAQYFASILDFEKSDNKFGSSAPKHPKVTEFSPILRFYTGFPYAHEQYLATIFNFGKSDNKFGISDPENPR